MSDDPVTAASAIHGIITGINSAAAAIFLFFGKRYVDKVDSTAVALANHEKDDVGKYATMDQLTRVHDRIDDSVKTFDEGFKEMRQSMEKLTHFLMNGGGK